MAKRPGSPRQAILPQPQAPLTIGLFLDLGVDLAHSGLQVIPAQEGPIHSTLLSQLYQSIKVTGSRAGNKGIVSQKSGGTPDRLPSPGLQDISLLVLFSLHRLFFLGLLCWSLRDL